jgi:predicted Rossmann fold flavoprotein
LFGVKNTIEFFEKRGLKLKTERGQRIFPKSDKAQDVLNVLMHYLKQSNVNLITNARVIKLQKKENKVLKAILKDKEIIADKYIIATGGKTYPQTGSTGNGLLWAEKLGHTISELSPALTSLIMKDKWIKHVKGLSLKNVRITVIQNNRKEDTRLGEALFTHFGLSGPIVLEMSSKIGDLLKKGEVKLSLDLKPGLDFSKLDSRIQRDFQKYSNKLFRNSLNDLLPQKMIPLIVKLCEINPNKKVNAINKPERQKLVKIFKNIEMIVEKLSGFKKAIITKGGISLKEIDSKTMKSKLIDNLFFAGEILDLDGPSGGYNLQICWTTGYLAGQSSAS